MAIRWLQIYVFNVIWMIWVNYETASGLSRSFATAYPFGAMMDKFNPVTYHALNFARESHDNNSSPHFTLALNVQSINLNNSLEVRNTMCTAMSKGVLAFYSQLSSATTSATNGYSTKFEMPLVSPSLPVQNTFHPVSTMVFTKPQYGRAIFDIIRAYKWNYIFYVYDSQEGFFRLLILHENIRKWGEKTEIESVRLGASGDPYELLRHLDRRANEDGAISEKYIVLDITARNTLTSLLKQLLNVGMNRYTYHYLIGGLDMGELNLSDFQYGGANITGFRLVNPDEPKVIARTKEWAKYIAFHDRSLSTNLTLEVALTMDALSVITEGIEQLMTTDRKLFEDVFRRGELYNKDRRGIQCDLDYEWMIGSQIAKAFKRVSFQGVTGFVEFDEFGFRKNFNLEVLELSLNSDPKKVGIWHSSGTLQHFRRVDTISGRMNGKPDTNTTRTRIVTSILSPPYLQEKKQPDATGEPLVGNGRYEGYCADLAKEIAEKVGFTYIIKPVEDGKYGEEINGKWNGLIGELTDRKADLAIAPLTINSERERVVDFSKPFMNLGISIIIKKPEKQKPGVFSFLAPLSMNIWICIIVAYLGVSLVLFSVSRFSPYEWQIEDGGNGPTYTNDFTLLNSLWFSLGAFMRQGCDVSPRSLSGRIVGSVWWFFTLILISSYTANLAAFLTVERMLTPIQSADDLSRQTDIAYGTLLSGSTKSFFEDSQVDTFKRMWEYMKNAKPSVFEDNTEKGVERVRNSKGKYAFLLESTMNEYYNQKKPCNTMKVGNDLDSKGYGIATPLDSDLKEEINFVVLQLLESGHLQALKNRWWYERGECTTEADSGGSSQSALTLSNVAGIFYILIGGLGLSMIVALLEFLYKSKTEARRQKKLLANSLRQNMRNSLRDAPEKENGGVSPFRGYAYSAPSQIISFDHSDYTLDSTHTQV